MTVAVIFLIIIRLSALMIFFPRLICYWIPIELLHCIEDHSKAGNTKQVNMESKPPKTLPSQAHF